MVRVHVRPPRPPKCAIAVLDAKTHEDTLRRGALKGQPNKAQGKRGRRPSATLGREPKKIKHPVRVLLKFTRYYFGLAL